MKLKPNQPSWSPNLGLKRRCFDYYIHCPIHFKQNDIVWIWIKGIVLIRILVLHPISTKIVSPPSTQTTSFIYGTLKPNPKPCNLRLPVFPLSLLSLDASAAPFLCLVQVVLNLHSMASTALHPGIPTSSLPSQ